MKKSFAQNLVAYKKNTTIEITLVSGGVSTLIPPHTLNTLTIAVPSILFVSIKTNQNLTLPDYTCILTQANSILDTYITIEVSKKGCVKGNFCVQHVAEKSCSKTIIKVIAKDAGQAYFTGKIKVEDTAKKSVSDLAMKGLLLDDEAKIELRPELEILHGNVRCSHGATVSGIPAEFVEYMMQRGLQKHQINKLYTAAFLS